MSDSRTFIDRLHDRCREIGSVVCVGIDPRVALLPSEFGDVAGRSREAQAEAVQAWAFELIDVVAPLCPIVKPQSAFFELLGWAGVRTFERVVSHARERGLLVLADAKRGDIGSTAEAYAAAFLAAEGADALTVNPYLGRETLEPFLARCRDAGKGIYVLVRTSNPGSADLQEQGLTGGGRLVDHVAGMVAELGDGLAPPDVAWTSVGAVVGATHRDELGALRAAMPRTPLLVPGYGAQGGGADDCRAGFGADGLGAVVNSSRGITFAFHKGEHAELYGDARWRESVAAATREMTAALAGVVPQESA